MIDGRERARRSRPDAGRRGRANLAFIARTRAAIPAGRLIYWIQDCAHPPPRGPSPDRRLMPLPVKRSEKGH
jgi:hypothetical protein